MPNYCFEAILKPLLDKLICGGRPSSDEGEVAMSEFSCWVTWNESVPNGNPFHFAKTNLADEVRANLGLDPKKRCETKRLLLLVYVLTGVTLFRPTVADAGLYPYFSPPPKGTKHGLSVPWRHMDSEPDEEDPPLNLKPRPEAVHSSARFGRIQSVLELL